jgi:hypothetical protein
MHAIIRGYGLWIAFLAILLTTGCHRDKKTTQQSNTESKTSKDAPKGKGGIPRKIDETKVKNDLRQLAIAYRLFFDANNRGPASADELAPEFQNEPKLKEALKTGQYILFWKVNLNAVPEGSSRTILGYEGTPDADGNRCVVMVDATTQKITEKEFEAAPKAQGK